MHRAGSTLLGVTVKVLFRMLITGRALGRDGGRLSPSQRHNPSLPGASSRSRRHRSVPTSLPQGAGRGRSRPWEVAGRAEGLQNARRPRSLT